jgi:hypothetical protein
MRLGDRRRSGDVWEERRCGERGEMRLNEVRREEAKKKRRERKRREEMS